MRYIGTANTKWDFHQIPPRGQESLWMRRQKEYEPEGMKDNKKTSPSKHTRTEYMEIVPACTETA